MINILTKEFDFEFANIDIKILYRTVITNRRSIEGTVSWKLRLNSGKKKEVAQEETHLLPSGFFFLDPLC